MRKRLRIRDEWGVLDADSCSESGTTISPLKSPQTRQAKRSGGGANEARRPQIMKKTPMSLWKRMKRERRRKT